MVTGRLNVNVLTGDLGFFNSRALVFPIVRYSQSLRDLGIKVSFFHRVTHALTDCDVLILDSKKFRNEWAAGTSQTLDQLGQLSSKVEKTIWFNTGDSTGGIQRQVIKLVDIYCKNQLLKDRSQYEQPFYGGRIFSDFYHREFGVNDEELEIAPTLFPPEIKKLRLSWNLGLNPNLLWKNVVKTRISLHPLMMRWISHPAERIKKRDDEVRKPRRVNCMFNLNYDRKSVAFQREEMMKALSRLGLRVDRLPLKKYYSALMESRYVISPFGWGEVCIRDFEAVVAGGALIKPDMSHLETWPNIYVDGETYISHSWHPETFYDQIKEIIESDRYDAAGIVEAARKKLEDEIGGEGGYGFAQYFERLVES